MTAVGCVYGFRETLKEQASKIQYRYWPVCCLGLVLLIGGAVAPCSGQTHSFHGADTGFPIQPSREYHTSIDVDMPVSSIQSAVLEIQQTNGDFNHELETLILSIDSVPVSSFPFAADNGPINRSLTVSIPLASENVSAWFADGRLDLVLRTSPYVNQSRGTKSDTMPSFFSSRLLVTMVPEPASWLVLAWAGLLSILSKRRHRS